MKVVSFAEGAQPGTPGLVGVPYIWHSFACQAEDNQAILAISGEIIPSAARFVRLDSLPRLLGEERNGMLDVRTFPALGRWAFSVQLWHAMHSVAREADLISMQSLYSFPVLVGSLFARLYHKPYAIWPHGALAPFQRRVHYRRKKVYDSLVARRVLNQADVVVFTTEGEREEARGFNLTAPSVIIPHGVATDEFENLPPREKFRQRYLEGYDGPLLLYLGRLNAKKGLDILLAAVRQVAAKRRDVCLAIVGGADPPSFLSQVEGWIKDQALADRTVLTGSLYGADKLAAFAAADVFVLPSHAENFGFAMFEAMASRVPVVISDTLNMAGEVARYGAGIVVSRDAQEFSEAILDLLGDAQKRKRLGENGVRLAKAYSWDACGDKVDRMVRSIVQGLPLPADLSPE